MEHHNGINFFENGASPDDRLFVAVGKAAEEEMLRECELWERQSEEFIIPDHVEARILAMAGKHEKSQLNKRKITYMMRYAKIAATVMILISVAFTVLSAAR